MAPRAAIRKLLGTDAELISLGFPIEAIFSSSTVDSPFRNQRWITVTCADDVPAFNNHAPTLVEVWTYQPTQMGRFYDDLQAAQTRIRELLTEVEQYPGDDGWTITGANYLGGSRDLYDPEFSALMKYSTFKVASRYVITP
jgi:hypothetical protein